MNLDPIFPFILAGIGWAYWQLAKNTARRRRRRAIMNMGIISGKPHAAQARRRTS